MRTGVNPRISGDQTIEIVICIIVAFGLLIHMLFRPESPVMKAVSEDDTAAVRQMIRASSDLNEPGRCFRTRAFYSTPLIEAARLGRREILTDLLDAGVDVNARDEYGTTALLAALSRGDVQASRALLEKGADPNRATCLGHGSCTTALRCARRLNHFELVHIIESAGGREDTSWFFPLECFWLNVRPASWFSATRIVPLVLFVLIAGSLIRRKIDMSRRSS